MRTDASGEKLWERSFSGAPLAIDRAHSVATLSGGGYAVSGILNIDGPEQTRIIGFELDSPLLQRPGFNGGEFSFFVNGTSNDYVIEFSADLFNWFVLGTNRISTTASPVGVVDPSGVTTAERFYRARRVP